MSKLYMEKILDMIQAVNMEKTAEHVIAYHSAIEETGGDQQIKRTEQAENDRKF